MSRQADQPFPRFSLARALTHLAGKRASPSSCHLLPCLLASRSPVAALARYALLLACSLQHTYTPPSLAHSPRDTHERRKYVSLSWLRLFMRCERYARASSSRTFSSVLHTSKQPSKRLHDLPSNWRNSSRISPPNLGVRPSNSLRQSNLLLLRRACAHHCNREVRLTLAS